MTLDVESVIKPNSIPASFMFQELQIYQTLSVIVVS